MEVIARPGIRMNRANYESCCSGEEILVLDVDLAELEFIDPYGLVSLACAIEGACRRGDQVQFVPPNDRNVANYLSRAGLAPLVARATGTDSLPEVRSRNMTGRLVALEPLTAGEALEDAADLVYDRVGSLCGARPVDPLRWALYELGYNIEEHSGTEGFVAAQVWKRDGGAFEVQLAVGDWGDGIPATLRGAGHQRGSDMDFIVDAAQSRLSRKEKDGGFGLPTTVREARQLGGHVAVRSGAAKVCFWSDGRQTTSHLRYPRSGTVVEVEMRCA